MSVESPHVANANGTVSGSTFQRRRSDNGGWSNDIGAVSYARLVAFLKEQGSMRILSESNEPLYHVDREPSRTCWDTDTMREYVKELEESDGAMWFHVDDNIDEEKPNTFMVKAGMSLTLLDLTFLGKHAEFWEQIVETVNQEPNLLEPDATESPDGIARYLKIEDLAASIGSSATGKDALHRELEKMGIFSNPDDNRWFWQAMHEVGADGYVSYDHGEARKVNTLSPGLLQRSVLPPIVDHFGHHEDAMVLASEDKSVHAHSSTIIVSSIITFPQVVLAAKGARKVKCIDPHSGSERQCARNQARRPRRPPPPEEDEDGEGDEEEGEDEKQGGVPEKGAGCTIS